MPNYRQYTSKATIGIIKKENTFLNMYNYTSTLSKYKIHTNKFKLQIVFQFILHICMYHVSTKTHLHTYVENKV